MPCRFRGLRCAPCLLLFVTLAASVAVGRTRADGATRVLFIGNSYTYFNNLPELFAKLAAAGHQGRVETRMLAPGGWRLADHWVKGDARKVLREEHWDFVVLQDQSTLGVSSFVDGIARVTSDRVFRPAAEQFVSAISEAGATPVFYLTWARKQAPEDQVMLNRAYLGAARATGARVAPAGLAWSQVLRELPTLELYIDDGSHPTPAGSYLAACALYATIFDTSPEGLPAEISGPPVDLDSAAVKANVTAVLVALDEHHAKILQLAAWHACEQVEAQDIKLDAPASAPTVTLPSGAPIVAAALEGKWRGELKFLPTGPATMMLELHHGTDAWQGTLTIRQPDQKEPAPARTLGDLAVGKNEITFVDANAIPAMKVTYRAVLLESGELLGSAQATSGEASVPVQLIGSWKLQRE